MPRLSPALLLLALPVALALPRAVEAQDADPPDVVAEVRTTEAGERILLHTVHVDAPVADVWAAHTTAEGWTKWAAPRAEIDLRVGGTYRVQHVPGAAIGDPGTNTLHVVNYVPNELLTLRAELVEAWPEVLKADADRLSNVILFDELGPDRTRVRSYGIGYADKPEYDQLLTFFSEANERLYQKLVDVLEADDEGSR